MHIYLLIVRYTISYSEGEITASIEYQGKYTNVHLTQVMHVPGADGKILSLKVLTRKVLRVTS